MHSVLFACLLLASALVAMLSSAIGSNLGHRCGGGTGFTKGSNFLIEHPDGVDIYRQAKTARITLFSLLPMQAREEINETKQACKEAGLKSYPDNADDPLKPVDLNGDGSLDVLVDWNEIGCAAGMGCSNRGCPVEIYKQVGPGSLKKVYSESVVKYFLSSAKASRFSLIITAQDGKCTPGQLKGECDYKITWQRGKIIRHPLN
jgi:hypothetical protein